MPEEKKLTKLGALMLCHEEWKRLAETGDGIKPTMRHAVFGPPAGKCWACEFGFRQFPPACEEACIMRWRDNQRHYVPCTHPESEFSKWCDALTRDGRKAHAKVIASMARKLVRKEWRRVYREGI